MTKKEPFKHLESRKLTDMEEELLAALPPEMVEEYR